ncbi:MAG TPA: acyltransferase family protein [Fibrobacteria bacterium]|nr:acyltransferase family protein [Fibrobacteria bacterium]
MGTQTIRDTRIDAIKGGAIILVVLGHAISSATQHSEKSKLLDIIYSFHMPLFFFASGYLTNKNTTFSAFARRCKSLIWPLVVWTPIFSICVILKKKLKQDKLGCFQGRLY